MKRWQWGCLWFLTAVTLVLEFTFLSGYKSHWWNYIPGFYIIWGFLGCAVIVYVSKWLGKLFIFRNEDYYDR